MTVARTRRRPEAPTRGALTPAEWQAHARRRLPGSGASPIMDKMAQMMNENYQRNTGNK